MPELPEVESVRRQLEPELSGRRVLAVWADTQRRFHAPGLLLGRTVEGVGRRGKFLLCPLDQDLELVLHLGMTGVLHFGVGDAYARARITLDDGRELVFRDVRRFRIQLLPTLPASLCRPGSMWSSGTRGGNVVYVVACHGGQGAIFVPC